MQRAALRLAALLSCGLLTGSCSSEEDSLEARDEARDAIARGARGEALRALERLRDTQPDTPQASAEYATLLIRAGEAPRAVWMLEDAVRRHDADELRILLASALLLVSDAARVEGVLAPVSPDSPLRSQALLIRARAELQLGDLERALDSFAEAERVTPDDTTLRLPRIGALLQERRFADAHAALAEAREASSEPSSVALLRRLEASVLSAEAQAGDPERALAGIRRLVDEDPEDAELWRTRVQALWQHGRHAEARDELRAALSEDPDRLALYSLSASIEASLGDAKAAEAVLRRWLSLSPSPTAYAALAQLHAGAGRHDQAIALLEEGRAAFRDVPLMGIAYAETLLDAGRIEAAERVVDALAEAETDRRFLGLLRARLELARGEAQSARRRLEALVPELDDATSQFLLARALELTGDFEGAERRYGLALIRNQRDPVGAIESFRLAARRGDWRTAVSHAQLVVQRAPGQAQGWRSLLTALVELGEGVQAVEVAERAVAYFPARAELHALHAAALRIQGSLPEALAVLEAARARNPESLELAAERALVLALTGKVDAGLAEVRAALVRAPENAELHLVMGTLLYYAGEAAAGDAEIDRALELAPDDLRPLRRRIDFRAATQRLELARSDAEQYLAQRPEDAHVHYVLGVVHERAGRSAEAITAYRRSAALDPTAHAPLNNLADLLGRQGELGAALEAAQQAYRIAEDDPYVLDTLGWLYLQRGLVDRSISMLEQARTLAPSLPEAQLHLALAYRDGGRTSEARALLEAMQATHDGALHAEVDEALESLH